MRSLMKLQLEECKEPFPPPFRLAGRDKKPELPFGAHGGVWYKMKLATISQTQGVGGSVSQQRGNFGLMMTILCAGNLLSWSQIKEKAQLYTEVIKGVPTMLCYCTSLKFRHCVHSVQNYVL